MKILRTPDTRFEGLPDFPFGPHYTTILGATDTALRMHYLDEGPRNSPPVLLLHGEPSWSFLYRKMIPLLVAAGHRVLAPDLIGFGRSDKPEAKSDYTFERHVAWMSEWIEQHDFTSITLFCQDWGGLIGLRLVARFPQRFDGVIAANTGLPAGGGQIPFAFKIWLTFSRLVPKLPVGWLISKGCLKGLTAAEKRAYDAPFPDERYKAGARTFPTLVPITDAHASVAENKQAWLALERFDRPFLTAFSDRDPITRGGDKMLQARIPGTRGQPHTIIQGAGHFLQEDKPAELAALINDMIERRRRGADAIRMEKPDA
jgi:haloalkane dehalogenase